MPTTQETLLALELALARRDRAGIPGGYETLLDNDFVEFGASGRRWTRADILQLVATAPFTDAIEIQGFEIAEIGSDVVLALFETVEVAASDGRTVRRRRSSIWLRDGDRFRVRFHQGTPIRAD